ncbi:MAG: hypothetical protein CM1200mP24_03880 [Gammaproteobacteria bacterium]|nr:MAG: hypothetical protein CM1200mP24_03880 [Gammaproteobacteria bacterium]
MTSYLSCTTPTASQWTLRPGVARERGLRVDQEGFDRLMQQQRERGRAASHFDASLEQSIQVEGAVEFCGYHELDVSTSLTNLYVIGPENKVSEVDHIPLAPMA